MSRASITDAGLDGVSALVTLVSNNSLAADQKEGSDKPPEKITIYQREEAVCTKLAKLYPYPPEGMSTFLEIISQTMVEVEESRAFVEHSDEEKRVSVNKIVKTHVRDHVKEVPKWLQEFIKADQINSTIAFLRAQKKVYQQRVKRGGCF